MSIETRNTANWLAAAQKYSTKQAKEVNIPTDQHSKEAVEVERKRRKEVASQKLATFLSGNDGKAAKELLRASRRHINFAVDREDSQTTTVYFLDANGLFMCIEATASMSNLYGQLAGEKPREPAISPLSAEEAIDMAITFGGKEPEQIMHWLQQELNKIANEAPR